MSTRTYGSKSKGTGSGAGGSAGSGGASGASNGRMAKQSSKKVLALEGAEAEASAGLDSPAVNAAVKRRYP